MNMRDKIATYLRENTELKNFDAVADGLEVELNETYTIGERTMAHVFRPAGLVNVSDPQAVFDQMEKALEALEKNVCRLPEGFSKPEVAVMLSLAEDEPQTNENGEESVAGWHTRLLRGLLDDSPEDEECIVCNRVLEEGDPVYFSADETGHICAECCGPERDSYVNADGEPLKDGEEIPEPVPYQSGEAYIAEMKARKLAQPLLPFIDKAALMVLEERAKQIARGWTPEHDDQHDEGEIALAAVAYAASAAADPKIAEVYFPWEDSAWKPESPERDLTRAGALAIAALGQLLRAKEKEAKKD